MKLAIVQMESVMGEVERNIDSALRLLDHAAASGAEVALLPEYWSTGFRTGTRFPVFGIDEWRVGIMLCYDTYFPEAARCLALGGAEVILAPFGISDTKKTIWKELLATRAFENIVYLAAANNTGYVPAPDMPIVMGGHSIAIDPYGEELAMASYDRDEVLRVDLDRDHLLRARRMHFMFRDRRPEAYGIISTPTDDIQRG